MSTTGQATDLLQVVELTRDEADVIAAFTTEGLAEQFASGLEYAEWLSERAGELPARLAVAVHALMTNGSPDATILRGLPLDRFHFPPTPNLPTDDPNDVAEVDAASIQLGLLAVQLGELVGYSTTQHGRIFTDLMPLQSEGEIPNATGGFRKVFGLHTDASFLPLPPTYFGMLCIRNEGHVMNQLGFLRALEIDDESRIILRETKVSAPMSFASQVGASRDNLPAVPILWDGAGDPAFRMISTPWNRDDFPTDEGFEAANKIKAALQETSNAVDLRPGDALFLDNLRVTHARLSFSPRFDGTDRWVKRATVVPSVKALEPARLPGAEARVLDYEALALRFQELPDSWDSVLPR